MVEHPFHFLSQPTYTSYRTHRVWDEFLVKESHKISIHSHRICWQRIIFFSHRVINIFSSIFSVWHLHMCVIGKENILKAINNSSSMTRIPFRHISMYIYRRMGYEPNKCLFEMAFSILKYGINQPLSICKCVSLCVCTSLDILLYFFYSEVHRNYFFYLFSSCYAGLRMYIKNIFFASSFRIFPYFQWNQHFSSFQLLIPQFFLLYLFILSCFSRSFFFIWEISWF